MADPRIKLVKVYVNDELEYEGRGKGPVYASIGDAIWVMVEPKPGDFWSEFYAYRVCVKREPDGETLCSKWYSGTNIPTSWFWWWVDYEPGTYKIRVWIEGGPNDTTVDEVDIVHVVEGVKPRIEVVDVYVNGSLYKEMSRDNISTIEVFRGDKLVVLVRPRGGEGKGHRYRTCLQRQPGGQIVCSGWKEASAPDLDVGWTVDYPVGNYTLRVWVEEYGVGIVDELDVPHVVYEYGKPPPEREQREERREGEERGWREEQREEGLVGLGTDMVTLYIVSACVLGAGLVVGYIISRLVRRYWGGGGS